MTSFFFFNLIVLLSFNIASAYTPKKLEAIAISSQKHSLFSSLIPEHVRIQHFEASYTYDLAIDEQYPTFSWRLPLSLAQTYRSVQQTAFQYVLTDEHQKNVYFDSGKIASSQNSHVSHATYSESPLISHTTYLLHIKIWWTGVDPSSLQFQSGDTDYSLSKFRTAFLTVDEKHYFQSTALWIGSNDIPMNELRKEFTLSSSPVEKAILYMSGIGYSHAFVNGELVDPSRRLDPGWTTYEKRTLYVSLDVTPFLNNGTGATNCIGIQLGNGWYSQEQYVSGQGEPSYGPPRVIVFLMVIYNDAGQTTQNITSDTTWQGRQGANVHDGVYQGSIYDAQRERPGWNKPGFIDNLYLWINASSMTAPVANDSLIQLQIHPPIRIGPDNLHIQTSAQKNPPGVVGGDLVAGNGQISPTHVGGTEGNAYDLGQNLAGWCSIRMKGPKNLQMELRHAETVQVPSNYTDHGLYNENYRNAASKDIYIFRGDSNGETIAPNFTTHGFRYISLRGAPSSPDDVICYFVHSETSLVGQFNVSNTVMNQIQHNIQWGQLSNAQSLPSDCPQRDERKGWMGDAGLTVDEALFNFDLHLFYTNFLNLIHDIQGSDGAVPDTVPFTFGSAPADPNWGTAYPTITWALYQHYSDLDIVKAHYLGVRSWVECVRGQYNSTGLKNLYYHYGDWVPPPPQTQTDPHLIASFPFLRDINVVINMAKLLNNSVDVQEYTNLYSSLAKEFHSTWYNSNQGGYADNKQTANALALALPNVVPDSLRATVLQTLLKDIQSHGHVTTGITGVANLYPVLSANGQHDVALQLVQDVTYPSYGWMFTNQWENATTMWELWDAPWQGPGMNSRNHHMFNSIGSWFYRYCAGFMLDGSNTYTIHPRMAYDASLMPTLHAEYHTIKGPMLIQYERDPEGMNSNSLQMSVFIPPNTQGKIVFEPLVRDGKAIFLTENGKLLWERTPNDNQVSLQTTVVGIRSLVEDAFTGALTAEVDSGRYDFMIQW